MKKKILMSAVGAALVAGPMLAHADVKIFGRLQAEFASIKIDGNACGTGGSIDCKTQRGIDDSGVMSRVGFDVSEDLGGGLKGVGRLEYTQSIANGAAPGAREQWVGLSGSSWGTIALGRHQAPMKYIGGAAYDIFVATALQARGSGGAMWAPGSGWGAAGFVNSSIKYSSPNMNGFVIHALVMPGNSSQDNATGTNNNVGGPGNGLDMNVAAKYGTKDWEVIAGISRDTANDAQKALNVNGKPLDDEKVYRLGGKFKVDALTVLGQYESIKNSLTSGAATASANSSAGCSGGSAFGGGGNPNPGTSGSSGTAQCNTAITQNSDGKIWFLALQYKLANNILVLQGGQTKSDPIAAQPEKKATNTTLGLVHMFSKQTRLFAGYQKVALKGVSLGTTTDPDRNTWTVGLRQDF